jgi:uncharacterized repeat protein (TIGR01451 family)
MKKVILCCTIAALLLLSLILAAAAPVMASQILATQVRDPDESPYDVGDTIHYAMTVSNPVANPATNELTSIWHTLPDGSVHWFIQEGVDPPLVQVPGDTDTFYLDYVVGWADVEYDGGSGNYIVKNGFGAEGYDSYERHVYVFAELNTQVHLGITLVSPAPGALNQPTKNLGFSWNLQVTADAFDWVLDDHADFSSPLGSATGLTSSAYTSTGTLAYSTTYYWQVTAYNEGAVVGASARGTFTTTAPQSSITSVAPTSGSRGEATNTTIYGSNLGGTGAISFGDGIEVSQGWDINGEGTLIVCEISISEDAEPGPRDVTVNTTMGAAVLENGFVVISSDQTATISVAVSPQEVPQPSDAQYVPLEDIPLRDIPLRDIDLSDTLLWGTSLDSTPLRDIALADIPLRDIGGIDWGERLQGTSFEGTPLRDITLGDLLLAGIQVDDITLEDVLLAMMTLGGTAINGTPLRDIVLTGTTLQDIPLRDIPLRDIVLANTPLRDIPLRDIPLRDITLLNIILGTPLRDIPFSEIMLEQLVLAGVPLMYTDFASTPLRDIPLEDIDIYGIPLQQILADTPLRDIPLRDISVWELSLASIAVQNITVDGIPIHYVSLEDIPLRDISWKAILEGSDLEGIPVRDISLGDLALAAAPLRDITIDGIPLRDIAQDYPYLHDYLMDIALEDIPSQSILIPIVSNSTFLEDIALEDLPLRDITWEALLMTTSLNSTPLRDITIEDVLNAGISLEDITLLDIVLGQVPLRDITLWDLLLAVLPLRDIPWESIPLRDIALQDMFSAQSAVTYTITLPNYSDSAIEGLEITHSLPQVFQYQPGSSNAGIGLGQNTTYVSDPVISGRNLTWGRFGIPGGHTLSLVFDAVAATSLGTYYSNVEASCNSTHDIVPALDVAPVTVADTFETNDSWEQAEEVSEDRLYISYISTDTDLDWYKFAVPEDGSMVTVYLSHLPDDYDLVLCANASMAEVALQAVPLQDTPLRDIPLRDIPLEDTPVRDIPLRDIVLQDIRLGDIPLDTIRLRDISIERGPTDEIAGDRVVDEEGYYYIMVSGYNGVYSDEPYMLRVSVRAPLPIEPCERDLPEAGDPGEVYDGLYGNATETIIVTNEQRLVQYYGNVTVYGFNGTGGLRSELVHFANLPNVKGMILPVDSNSTVRDAYNAWDGNAADPQAANNVAAAIRLVLRDAILSHHKVEYVVIVGSDEIVPFHRVPDETYLANEYTYATQAHLVQPSALYASLLHGYVMTDDYYVDMAPVPWMGRELYVPDYAIGRLVETPAEISGMLNEFETSTGELVVKTALVTGYIFLTDAGIAIKSALLGKGINAADIDALINENWTGSDLQSILAGSSSPDISSINAHCNHYGIGSPANITLYSYQISLQEDGRLIFSTGCHAGLNVDGTVSTAGHWSLDLPQAFAEQAAWYIGNTGYGYGDSEIVALSEELMLSFAEALGSGNKKSVPVGQALMDAKRHYLLNMGSYGPFDEKIMIESTLYGLPMYMIDPDVPANPGEDVVAPDLTVTVDQYHDFLPVGSLNGTSSFARIHADDAEGDGDYFVVLPDGESQFVPYRPIQPKTSMRIELRDTVAHGALFTGGTYDYLLDFNPVIARPTWDTSKYEPQFINDVWYPYKQQTIMSLQTSGGVKQALVVIPGQFITTSADTEVIGLERLYSSMDYDVYYSNSTDFRPPIIGRVGVNVTGSTAHFEVRADDFMGTVEKVVLAWTYSVGDDTWESMELGYNPSSEEWIGDLNDLTDRIDFMVQAVDAAGNVGVSTSKGLFTTQNTAPANLEIDAPIAPVMVGGDINASAMFSDQPGDTHTATWDWGDGLLSDGNVVEPGIVDEPGIKTYFVSGEHTYNAAGVYTVTLTVSDNRGQSAESTFHVVIYAWWLIILLIVAIGLIIWGIVWGRRRRRKAHQQA